MKRQHSVVFRVFISENLVCSNLHSAKGDLGPVALSESRLPCRVVARMNQRGGNHTCHPEKGQKENSTAQFSCRAAKYNEGNHS